MNTIDLLNGLQDYVTLLSTVKEKVITDLISKDSLKKTLKLSYSFITLELELKKNDREHLHFQCKFEIKNESVSLSSIYCEDPIKQAELKKFIEHHAPSAGFPSTINFNNYHPNALTYFTIADEIAKTVIYCSSGDDYRPGYYSEIIITEYKVTLRQINWHNAKSSAHKDNYHMRELEFFIPLSEQKLKSSFSSEHIGDMLINFRDNSSKQNKSCGDRIREKIEEEKQKFGI